MCAGAGLKALFTTPGPSLCPCEILCVETSWRVYGSSGQPSVPGLKGRPRALVHPRSLLTMHRARALRWGPGIFASMSYEPSPSFSTQGGSGSIHQLDPREQTAPWKQAWWLNQPLEQSSKLSLSFSNSKANPKDRQCQRMLKLPHNCTHLTC